MNVKLLVNKDYMQPDFMGCGAYEYCVETNSFHISIPKGSIIEAKLSDWKGKWNSIPIIFKGKERRIDKTICSIVE